MKTMIKILVLLVSILVLSGCGKFNESDMKLAMIEAKYEGYREGKILGESCNDEIRKDVWKQGYESAKAEMRDDFSGSCRLFITDGERPRQNPLYIEQGFEQFDESAVVRIPVWDIETDDIRAYGDDGYSWKYWVICR